MLWHMRKSPDYMLYVMGNSISPRKKTDHDVHDCQLPMVHLVGSG